MMSVGLHCRLVGRPGRAEALRRFLDHVRAHDGVWFATRLQIAEHWARTHPPERGDRPSEMDRETLRRAASAASSSIRRGSLNGRHATGDSAPRTTPQSASTSALARAFRSAAEEERLGVLTAHPDLAGKLAAAKKLTAESTSEQAGAGLDALTDEERAAFTRLNEAYVAKHGFPFIIAVRDHDKAGILAAFERRIDHEPRDRVRRGVPAGRAHRPAPAEGPGSMKDELHVQPLSAAEFAAFGDVLEASGQADKIINQGRCGRFHDRARLDFRDGRAGISLFDAQPCSLPFSLEMVERHPKGSQAFVPMHSNEWLVVVAPDAGGTPGTPVVFRAAPGQGINLHRGVWHGVLTPLHSPGLFCVIDRIGTADEQPDVNLEEHWFDVPWQVVD